MAIQELAAIEAAYQALRPLDEHARRRALRWLSSAMTIPGPLPTAVAPIVTVPTNGTGPAAEPGPTEVPEPVAMPATENTVEPEIAPDAAEPVPEKAPGADAEPAAEGVPEPDIEPPAGAVGTEAEPVSEPAPAAEPTHPTAPRPVPEQTRAVQEQTRPVPEQTRRAPEPTRPPQPPARPPAAVVAEATRWLSTVHWLAEPFGTAQQAAPDPAEPDAPWSAGAAHRVTWRHDDLFRAPEDEP